MNNHIFDIYIVGKQPKITVIRSGPPAFNPQFWRGSLCGHYFNMVDIVLCRVVLFMIIMIWDE